MDHPLYAFSPPGSLRQHLRFDRELVVEEDFYRHACFGYGAVAMPKKDISDENTPAQLGSIKSFFGDRKSTSMVQAAALTEMCTDQRKNNYVWKD